MSRPVKGKAIRALVLAAGRGERLRPLTSFVPKPLLPVAGRAVAGYSLERLAGIGCEAVAINLHHRAESIERHFGAAVRGVPLTYSHEPELLGTLGALRQLKDFFATADAAVVVNGDSLCRWPLRRMIRRHLAGGAAATLLVSESADPADFGGGVGLDDKGDIVELRAGEARRSARVSRRAVFAGAHILSGDVLRRACEGRGPADFIDDLYAPLLAEGARLQAIATRQAWHDLGTPRRYLEGAYDWGRGRYPRRFWRHRWVARSARLERGARVRLSVVESGARIARGARVEESLVLDDAVIGSGSRLRRTIVAPGVRLPRETWVERRLVTPLKAGRDPGANDSVVGRLVYTPI